MNMTVRKAEAVQALPIKQAAEVVRLKAPQAELRRQPAAGRRCPRWRRG